MTTGALVFVLCSGCHAAIGLVLSSGAGLHCHAGAPSSLYVHLYRTDFVQLGAIDGKHEWLLAISPSHAASHLIGSAVQGEYILP